MLFILPVCGFNVVSNCLICPVLESVLLAEDSIVPAGWDYYGIMGSLCEN